MIELLFFVHGSHHLEENNERSHGNLFKVLYRLFILLDFLENFSLAFRFFWKFVIILSYRTRK
ncbi:hypothetical protein EY675_09090 [Enterococcus casseliflavus]|nr:predicted protein [Enterococcus casseliflavus EC30]EEV35084.1 predicted protein [Enterococcus casseliflavus EC10]MBO6385698.1 hypothetical protein [Enterococcus casseliflavus]